jgi:hypothetical protein
MLSKQSCEKAGLAYEHCLDQADAYLLPATA